MANDFVDIATHLIDVWNHTPFEYQVLIVVSLAVWARVKYGGRNLSRTKWLEGRKRRMKKRR